MATLNTYEYDIGISIEGIGSDSSKLFGDLFGYSTDAPSIAFFNWQAGSLTAVPPSIDTAVNPTTGTLAVSALQFSLNNNDTIAPLLLWQARDDSYRIGNTGGISASATSVTITDASGTAITALASSVIWVGDEAMLLGSHSGSGVYAITTRAMYFTTAQAHDEGRHVYTSNPYLRFRQVRLYIIDRTDGSGSTLWRGYIDEIETSDDGTMINISCLELFASIADAVVNREAPNLVRQGVRGFIQGTTSITRVRVQGVADEGQRVRKSGGNVWVQVDDALAYGVYASGRYNINGRVHFPPNSDVDDTASPEKIYEVFCVDKTKPTQSSTADLTRPFHPLEIALALLTSTFETSASGYDVLNGHWGLGVPLNYIDTTSWTEEIQAAPGLKIDRLLLGWDGEPVDVWNTITEKLLRPYGYFLGTSTEGELNVSRYELFDVAAFAAASDITALPSTLKWSSARSSSTQQVVFSVGELPWREPDTLTVSARDGRRLDSLRSGVFSEKRSSSFDFSTRDDVDAVQALALERINLGFYSMPRLMLRVANHLIGSLDYDMGAVVNVAEVDIVDAWFINVDGTRVAVSDTTQMVGQIIGRRLDLTTMTYTLTILLTNYGVGGDYIRWRAPSAVVSGTPTNNGDGTYNVVVEANTFNASSSDASFFRVGDDVTFFSPSGVYQGVAYDSEITAISSNTITINTPSSIAASGDIMRLVEYDNYSNSSVISGSGIANVYAYQADASDTLGASADTGHRYG